MKDLQDQIRLIKGYPTDIRAEVLLADLILDGLSPSDIHIFFNGSFKRGYSNDVLKVEKLDLNSTKEILGITLARDGLYDLLPEGLFHAVPETALSSGKGMASDSRRDAKTEEETRKFFLPFENEFFYQRIQLELKERSILQKLEDNNLEDFFLDFWKIDRSLPKELIVKLTALLPYIKEIAGNFKITAYCLGAILGEEVTYSIKYSSKSPAHCSICQTDDRCCLGRTSLGADSVIGFPSPESCKLIKFSIGPLIGTSIDGFLVNGDIARFIDCFFSYFIPMEIDAEFDVVLPEELNKFILDSEKANTIMGYSTFI